MSALPDVVAAAANDADAQETREWLDALQAVIGAEGPRRRCALAVRSPASGRRDDQRQRAQAGRHRTEPEHELRQIPK